MKNQREEKQSRPFQRRPVSNLTNRLSASSCYNAFRVYLYTYIYTGCGNKSRAMKKKKKKEEKKDKFFPTKPSLDDELQLRPLPPPSKKKACPRNGRRINHVTTLVKRLHNGIIAGRHFPMGRGSHPRAFISAARIWLVLDAIARKGNLILSTVRFERREKGHLVDFFLCFLIINSSNASGTRWKKSNAYLSKIKK